MANKEHLEILKQGVEVWNEWREDNPGIRPDLSDTDLTGMNSFVNGLESDAGGFSWGDDFTGIDMSDTNLSLANLSFGNLSGANFSRAELNRVDLSHSDLRWADFSNAMLHYANLYDADLNHANFGNANLSYTNLNGTNLRDADFEEVIIADSSFSNVDLSVAKGLDQIKHDGPSSIGIDTLYKSGGKIPVEFLRGCGVPEEFITYSDSLIGAREAIQFYSCFISYSTKDEEFVRRLYSRMRDEKLRVWFAPEDMKGGRLLHEQIEQAIQLHDRLLVVLSEESMASEWVKREIRNARRAEKREDRRKLFPIRLVDFDAIANWNGFEGDGAEDLAFELGKFYIPDFSNWKNDHDAFEREFEKLLRDLRAEEGN